jgi:hypothetical protein
MGCSGRWDNLSQGALETLVEQDRPQVIVAGKQMPYIS